MDDHDLILQATRRLLMSDCDVVGQISSGLLVVEAAARLHPDIVVLDVNMLDVNGLDICRHLWQSVSHVRVIVLTSMNDADVREEAFRRGASAFVSKSEMGERLLPTILSVFHARRG